MKKILSFLFIFAFFATTVSFTAPEVAQAAPVFPSGCSSAIGYSITTGSPCNGTATATTTIVGCTTPLGYSTVNGVPCSGASEAIFFLAGCTSTTGYSTITAAPCNGTPIATIDPGVVTPGLPTTGAGGMASINSLLLTTSGLIVISGIIYFTRRTKTSLNS